MRAIDTFEARALIGELEFMDPLPQHAVAGKPCRPGRAASVIPDASPDMRSALIGLDDELSLLHGAPHHVEDHGLAHAWVVARAALWPAGSRAGGGR